MDGISRETFEQMDIDSKLNILFDLQCTSLVTCQKLEEKTNKLEIRAAKWGAVGGIVSALGAFLAATFIGHISTK